MSKEEKAPKAPKVLNEDILKAVNDGFNRICENLEKMSHPLIVTGSQGSTTFNPVAGLQNVGSTTSNAPLNPIVVSSTSRYPIPVEFRDTVDNILNKKFGIEIDYLPTTASFQFSVLVPKEYSNATEDHWLMHKEDRRSKVIENALGINGVRDWATKVYENMNPEMKSRIFYDRSQVNL